MPTQMTHSESRPTHEEIARRAQAIYEESGRVPGRDQQNWLKAEAQLMGARKRDAEGSNNANAGARPAAKTPQQPANNPLPSISQRS
jgi:hypothetical protein